MEVRKFTPIIKVVFSDGMIMYFGSSLDSVLSDISKYIIRENVISVTFSKSCITEF